MYARSTLKTKIAINTIVRFQTDTEPAPCFTSRSPAAVGGSEARSEWCLSASKKTHREAASERNKPKSVGTSAKRVP